MSELSPHVPDRTALHGPESAGSPIARPANALATAVKMSGGEEFARQRCSCRSPHHRDENGDLGGTAHGRVTPDPPCPWLWTMAIDASIRRNRSDPQ
jgi:hypothetical protein